MRHFRLHRDPDIGLSTRVVTVFSDLALLAHLAPADHECGFDVIAQSLVRRANIIEDRVLFILRGASYMKGRLTLDRLF